MKKKETKTSKGILYYPKRGVTVIYEFIKALFTDGGKDTAVHSNQLLTTQSIEKKRKYPARTKPAKAKDKTKPILSTGNAGTGTPKKVNEIYKTKNFKPASTVIGAAKYAEETLKLQIPLYNKLHSDTANILNERLQTHFELFPQLKGLIKGSGEGHDIRITLMPELAKYLTDAPDAQMHLPEKRRDISHTVYEILRQFNVSSGTYGVSYSMSPSDSGAYKIAGKYEGIYLNQRLLKNSNIERDVAHKFHPVGTGSVKAVIDHEVGHQIDSLLNLSEDKYIIKKFDKAKMDKKLKELLSEYPNKISEGAELVIGKTLTQEELINKKYRKALKARKLGIAEMIAECWSEYSNNANCRDFAKSVGNHIIDTYNKQYKKTPPIAHFH